MRVPSTIAAVLMAASTAAVAGAQAPAIADAVPGSVPRLVNPLSGSDSAPGQVVALSDAYYTRLRVHRYTAYAIVPLFAYQAMVGKRLWDGVHDGDTPDWVRPAHQAGAVAIGTAFAINAVTGGMNLWESRAEPEGRVMRYLHAAGMTTALAGFTYAGARLSQQAETSAQKREQHRNVALGSMALTLVSGTAMWLANR